MIPGGVNELLLRSAAAGGATAGRSVRFNSADSAYLSRGFSSGDQKKWTWSCWCKPCALSGDQALFGVTGAVVTFVRFKAAQLDFVVGGATHRRTTAVFRDPSAWYHFVWAVDTSQSTASNRSRFYVNGVEVTAWSIDSALTQNSDTGISSNATHLIGSTDTVPNDVLNAYLALVHFVGGQQLTPSSFGETSATTGQWIAKDYSGSYGTNGFFLDFLDNSTAAALGYDAAGSNDWTVNNIATGSNYSTNLTPASTAYPNTTLSNGGLTWTGSTTNDTGTVSSLAIPTNKKTYVEVTHTSTGGGDPGPGVANGPTVEMGLDTVKAWWRGGTNGSISASTLGAFTGGTTTWSNGDVLGIALDHTANSGAGSITFYKNGVQAWTGGSGWTSYNDLRFEWQNNGSGTDSGTWNYGLTAFSYPVAGHTGLFAPVGAGEDSLRDHPTSAGTSTGLGGEVSGNYCTINPLTSPGTAYLTISNGNLDQLALTEAVSSTKGTIGVRSGKWYWEVRLNTLSHGGVSPRVGICRQSAPTISQANGADEWIIYMTDYPGAGGRGAHNSTTVGTDALFSPGDIGMFALDMDNSKIYFGKNGTWLNSGNPVSGTGAFFTDVTGEIFPLINTGYYTSVSCNFGQRAWSYTAPSGFSPLVDTLLPTPTIAKPNTVMDVVTYTGTGSSRSITGLGFSPDLVWLKARSTTAWHEVFDSVRGALNHIFTNDTAAESTLANTLTSFDSNGFSLGSDQGVNWNTVPFVGWCWDAGSSNATNTSGTITSTVRANISAGFSIVTWTGNGSNSQTVGHGLGVAPSMIIYKRRNAAGDWKVYHSTQPSTYLSNLNEAGGFVNNPDVGAPNSSTIVVSSSSSVYLNQSSATYVAYCWAPVSSYSSFGQYTGNGSTDGLFVYTGFRPAVVLVKMSSSTGNWTILDDKREGYNVDNDPLYPNLGSVEGTTDLIDITSNGFKVRTTDATFNTNAGTYIYAAWASAPFPYSRAR